MSIFQTKKTQYVNCALSFLITFLLLFLLYFLGGYAPFGTNSLAWEDANIQYLSFFSYLKDVMAGENDIAYTFSKSLGGSCIGILAYYLMSPFHLLLVFFRKSQLHVFFDLITALKLATAAGTFSVFISSYFEPRHDRVYHNVCVILLSLSYAFCQYCIAQSSNTMWLDGVYMLPLILMGIHKLVWGGKSWLLSVCVGLSILFNWYTGGINCLFAIIWMVFELAAFCSERQFHSPGSMVKTAVGIVCRFGLAMAVGVMLSCVLFLPTVLAMRSSSRGELDFSKLADWHIGGVSKLISSYTLGAKSSKGNTALFCGSFALIGCMSSLFTKGISRRKKVLLGLLGLAGILLLCWNPLYVTFSLFKSVYSFWCRYSYVVTVIILFLAAHFYLQYDSGKECLIALLCGLVFSAVLLILNQCGKTQSADLAKQTAVSMSVIAAAAALLIWCAGKGRLARLGTLGIAAVLILAELAYGAKLQMDNYHVSNVAEYEAYTLDQQKQIDQIREYDSGTYRISQTSTRSTTEKNLTAHYDEPFAYGFWSITSYSSAADQIQLQFLSRLGYPNHGDAMNVVNTSILAADSLLGVKYITSQYPITGLQSVAGLDVCNGKTVYENPYALPFALCYGPTDGVCTDFTNPFAFQNQLYSQLLGEETALYIPLEYELVQQNHNLVYHISLPEGNYACYGNIPCYQNFNAVVSVNGVYDTGYAGWLTPSVFYIPAEQGAVEAIVEMNAGTDCAVDYGNEQFFALDLDLLAEVTEVLRAKAADEISVENGRVEITAAVSARENLYISIPYDECWTVTLNGQEIDPELFGECMYSIPLQEGENKICMTYRTRGIPAGIFASAIGLLALIAIWILEKKYMQVSRKPYAG